MPKTNHLILTFHYYEPPEFTFQESPYLGYESYQNVKWLGTIKEKQQIAKRLAFVREWAKINQVPVYLVNLG